MPDKEADRVRRSVNSKLRAALGITRAQLPHDGYDTTEELISRVWLMRIELEKLRLEREVRQ